MQIEVRQKTTLKETPLPAKTLLIVEGHDVLRASLRDFLKTFFPGCRLLEAKNGEESLAIASRENPEVILMDMGLPGINGIEITRRIKTRVPQARVVVIGTHDSHEYRAHTSESGAIAYLVKDKIGMELIPLITKLLSHPADRDGKSLGNEEFGDSGIW
jgi:two-component system, NarL family, invasion response regulator UvrY